MYEIKVHDSSVSVYTDTDFKEYVICNLRVPIEDRRKYIGSQLLQMCIDYISKDKSIHLDRKDFVVWLSAEPTDDSISRDNLKKFYIKNGFIESIEEKNKMYYIKN